jgi:MFS family permease
MLSQAPIPGVAPATVVSADFDGHHAGVSWSAVFAGAAAAAALSFILLILGFGLGLSAVSPWRYSDAPIGRSTILWLTFMPLASAAVGGYLAGRLRVKWASVHDDEVYFRDTAHGLLAWAVATLLTAAVMAGAVSAVFSGATKAAAAALWMFIALLIGAFVASFCATFGGRLRDRVTLHPSRV